MFWDTDFKNHIKFEQKLCCQGETDSFGCFASKAICPALHNLKKIGNLFFGCSNDWNAFFFNSCCNALPEMHSF